MFGTVIVDAFRREEADSVADAIEHLCAPYDQFGWASAGVYAFFNPGNQETLYIGMARDLSIRFQQHLGLLACEPRCCKIGRIDEYFAANQKLGLALLVQSPLDQPDIRRTKHERNELEQETAQLSLRGIGNAYYAESVLLETHRIRFSRLPPWNDAHGIKIGRVAATTEGQIGFLRNPRAALAVSGKDDSDFTARRTLRALCTDSVAEGYEENLHGARICILNMGMTDLADALAFQRRLGNTINVPLEYLHSAPQL